MYITHLSSSPPSLFDRNFYSAISSPCQFEKYKCYFFCFSSYTRNSTWVIISPSPWLSNNFTLFQANTSLLDCLPFIQMVSVSLSLSSFLHLCPSSQIISLLLRIFPLELPQCSSDVGAALSFGLSESVFILLFLTKGILPGCRILRWQSQYFGTHSSSAFRLSLWLRRTAVTLTGSPVTVVRLLSMMLLSCSNWRCGFHFVSWVWGSLGSSSARTDLRLCLLRQCRLPPSSFLLPGLHLSGQ